MGRMDASPRARRRLSFFLSRVRSTSDRLLGSVVGTARAELLRTQAFEEGLFRHPIRLLGLGFESGRGWSAAALEEPFRSAAREAGLGFFSAPLIYKPERLHLPGLTLLVLACSITPYATFIAFQVTADRPSPLQDWLLPPDKAKPGIRVLTDTGNPLNAVDASLHNALPGGQSRVGLVAFEPFPSPASKFHISFPPFWGTSARPVTVYGQAIREITSELPNRPTLTENFRAAQRAGRAPPRRLFRR